MTFFDLILLLILFGFIWFDFWYGLVYAIGGIIGLIFGTLLATRWYAFLANKLLFLFGENENLAKIVCFIVLFLIIWRLIAWFFTLLNRFFNFLTFIPFLKSINRLAGAVLGFFEGALILGLVLFFLTKFPLGGLSGTISSSAVAQFLITIAKILWPLLPTGLKHIKGLIT
ncbi:CvpA family protein [bacterium]|nr:CvpA family protein [bacterium]